MKVNLDAVTIRFLFSGMCSAGAPTAGHEPPAAAAGDGTGRPAGEEGC